MYPKIIAYLSKQILLGSSLNKPAEFDLATKANGASTEIVKDKFPLNQMGIASWLRSKHIISDDETLLSFHDLMPWTRTGGETYGTTFEFTTDQRNSTIFIKALTTYFPDKNLNAFASRRNFLASNGISVSHWYHAGDAVIIEDFYPNTAKNVPFEKILEIGFKLDKLGFSTLKFTDDLRADQNGNPYFCDFGFDLGEPSSKRSTSAMQYLIQQYPERYYEIINYFESKEHLEDFSFIPLPQVNSSLPRYAAIPVQ